MKGKKVIISDPDDEVSHIYETQGSSEEAEVEETQTVEAYD